MQYEIENIFSHFPWASLKHQMVNREKEGEKVKMKYFVSAMALI